MRISDSILSYNFLNQLNITKSRLEKLRTQIAYGTKINKPSDSPSGTTKILRLSNQLAESGTYTGNIENSLAFMKETVFQMESIQAEVTKVLTWMTEVQNSANSGNLNSYADQVDLALKAILNSANSQSEGKYVFGGTDFSGSPFGYAGNSIELKINDASGEHIVKVSPNISQKINTTGAELFGSIISSAGNFDSAAAAGTVINNNLQLNAADGTDLTLSMTFTKTAANTYDLSYDITDTSGTSIFSPAPAAVQLVFNPLNGSLESVNGTPRKELVINNPALGTGLTIDLNELRETASAASVSLSASQQADIFNTLIRISGSLRNGNIPTVEDQAALEEFNKHVLDKTVESSNVMNQLYDTQELLDNQKIILEELLSNEQEIDVAKAAMELQNQDYLLQLSYQLYSTILPKSLLDYM